MSFDLLNESLCMCVFNACWGHFKQIVKSDNEFGLQLYINTISTPLK